MATKNIPRTIMEGGRTDSSKAERRQFNRSFRHRSKLALEDFRRSGAEEIDVTPQLEPAERDFGDKLSPAYRWLARHGRGMTIDELDGLVRRAFDSRSLRQWHVGYAHLCSDLRVLKHLFSERPYYRIYSLLRFDEHDRLIGLR